MAKLTQETKPGPAIEAINEHDHSDGLGKPISTNGIEDGAVTTKKMASGAVTSAIIAPGAVGTVQLDEGLAKSLEQNITAGVNAPAYYERDVPFHFHHKTIIASPNRLWLNIGKRGFLLEEQKMLDISLDAAFDSRATKWQPEHDYVRDDVVYPSDTKTGFYYRCVTSGKSSSLQPEFPKTLGQSYNDGNVVWICEHDFTVAENRGGLDFYIYACQPTEGVAPVLMVSANSTVPLRYTSENSRKVGGFHCECADVETPTPDHWMRGWKKGEIIPFAVWDLKHRPSGAPEGMTWIPGHGWIGIYFLSNSGTETDRKLVTKFEGVIADGSSTPKWNDFDFIETLMKQSQSLPINDTLTVGGLGTPTGVGIKGGIDPVTTGGHVNTIGTRIVSYFGMEDGSGVMWTWARDFFSSNNQYYHTLVSCTWEGGSVCSPHFVSGIPIGTYRYDLAARAFAEDCNGNFEVLDIIKERLTSIHGGRL
jgi:hypothetical protein